MTQEQFINTYLNKPYILSGYSCFYENQDNSINISAAALNDLGASRKKYKKKMEAAEHDSDDYIYYRILQLTYKVLMNSYYGILGQKDSVFYNSYVQNSITMTGQDLITTSIIAMESFLSNNVPFEDNDDILGFIMNVKREKYSLNILDYLDEPVGKQELLEYFKKHMRHPEVFKEDIIKSFIDKMDLEMVNRCYYKNQILSFIDNSGYTRQLINNMLPFEYAEQPAEEMKEDLEKFKAILLEFCHYDVLYEDRYKRAVQDYRKSVITIDTDSNFINLNPYIEHITEKFSLNPKNEKEQLTLINIFINLTTEILKRTFWKLTTNMGLIDEAKPIINMKQEFLYRKILLTANKKSYAGIITAELGNVLPKPILDMKGLSIRKSSVPKILRKKFTDILLEDVLKADEIDLKTILNRYDELAVSIEESLRNKEVIYSLPKNIEAIDKYKTPEQIEAVRAMLIWNALEPEDQIIPPEKINMLKLKPELFESVQNFKDLFVIELLADKKYYETVAYLALNYNLELPTENPEEAIKYYFSGITKELWEFLDKYPDKVISLAKTIYNIGVNNPQIDISRFGFSCVAIPKGTEEIPEYLLPFIDYETMVNNNMTNGYIILESLGIFCETVGTTQYKSNIVQI